MNASSRAGTNSLNSLDSTNVVVLPKSIPDPIEPANRVVWVVNKELMRDVVSPLAKGYRFVVIKPVRLGINNFGRNLKYPGRLFNNLLEGNWLGAGYETRRFICNTLGGVGGLIDVTGDKIPKSNADFARTFAQWGWKPDFFIMLPILGPSNDRDAVGLAADAAASPVTYFDPYSYAAYGIAFNDLSDNVDRYKRFAETEMDPYSEMRFALSFASVDRPIDWKVKGATDPAILDTLQAANFSVKNPEFPGRGRTRSVLIPATGKHLKYSCWIRSRTAPVVYIIPGLGAHRLVDNTLGLAELIYNDGFSVVCVSNPYNYEFMENASTAAMPAYTPIDARDLHQALTEIDRQLQSCYPGRLGPKALLGYSMGAFQSLYIAATETNNAATLMKFDRYVGINTPVRLLYGISKLDEFYQAPLAWPEAERADRIDNTLRKFMALRDNPKAQLKESPFDTIESKFLIGLVFRFTLRDIIYFSQRRYNQGFLHQPIRVYRREALYREILQYSYADYFKQFVLPYYQTRGLVLRGPDVMEKINDLHTYSARLRANPNIRIVTNRNDFLLAEEDLQWLRETFPPEHLTIFEHGGHLGNLAQPSTQKTILSALEDLKTIHR